MTILLILLGATWLGIGGMFTAIALRAAGRAGRIEAQAERDGVWRDAMKWAGVGGINRIKIMTRVDLLASRLRSKDGGGG